MIFPRKVFYITQIFTIAFLFSSCGIQEAATYEQKYTIAQNFASKTNQHILLARALTLNTSNEKSTIFLFVTSENKAVEVQFSDDKMYSVSDHPGYEFIYPESRVEVEKIDAVTQNTIANMDKVLSLIQNDEEINFDTFVSIDVSIFSDQSNLPLDKPIWKVNLYNISSSDVELQIDPQTGDIIKRIETKKK